jgi:Uncharacterized conserved protein (DUF2267)
VKKTMLRMTATAGVVVGIVWVARQLWPQLPQARDAVRRARRAWPGRWDGLQYRLLGRRPDPWVRDDVLAERVRATLGPLEQRLDVPRVDVGVRGHIATLHGHVASPRDAREIEWVVDHVSGIFGLESYLETGFARGETRPSEGRLHPAASSAKKRLLAAAERAGVKEDDTAIAVRAVLGAFTDRIPPGEREHLLLHLPVDARRLAAPPSRVGSMGHSRTVPELLQQIASLGLTASNSAHVTEAVLAELRALVPEETSDVAAVLPGELRELWNSAVPA